MNTKRKQPPARPAALSFVSLRITCQDCNRPIARPSGNETWSVEEYARHAVATRGRGKCPHCGAAIRFNRFAFVLIPEPSPGPSHVDGPSAS